MPPSPSQPSLPCAALAKRSFLESAFPARSTVVSKYSG